MTISELAAKGGVGVETIRYYQRRGLLEKPVRGQGATGIRHYGRDDLQRLNFIRSAQTAGFTLNEIGELIRLDESDDRDRVRSLANARIAALDSEIAEKINARDALHVLARRCAVTEGDAPCPILQTLSEAAPE